MEAQATIGKIRSYSVLALTLIFFGSSSLWAQEREIPIDTTTTSQHQVTIGGEQISYTAEAGFQPVWNDSNQAEASLFYTYYQRTDVDDVSDRPLVFSFNGGPGSASVWMHIGYTGPRFLHIDDEGYPVQPYGIQENEHSILDVADIVYVDPVNTGFSRFVDDDADEEDYFGVNADVEYLSQWIENFISRHDRWTSPKYLKGESYGTTRVAGLASRLQNSHWMYINGVILVSPTGMGIDRSGPVGDALSLPYYTAAAWYHEVLPEELQHRELDELLPEVEEYTLDVYIPALSRSGSLDEQRRDEIADQVAWYSGISAQKVRDHNLSVPTSYFWKDLKREHGITIGRLDSRYRGKDEQDAGERYEFDPALSSWNHAFTPAINHYLREKLGVETDLEYNIFGPVHPWDRDDNNTGRDLRRAMGQNPYLHIMVQSGYYDGATDYFSAKYTMWNMDPGGRFQDRMRFEGYESGHMMYLRQEDLETSNEHIREFIHESIPEEGMPARY